MVERLIQTIKNRLACIKEEKSSTNCFNIKHVLKINNHQRRICKQKTTKISPFEAQFGRKTNTPLSVISAKPKLSKFSFENIKIYFLDEDIVTSEAVLTNDKWQKGYRSDFNVKKGMTRTTKDANNWKRDSTDHKSSFLLTALCRPMPISERAVQSKLARKLSM